MTKEQRAKIVKYLEQTLRKMRGLFSNTYIQSIAEMKDAIEAGADFKWENFKAQSLKIDKMIESLLNKSEALIFNGIDKTYQISCDSAVKSITDKYNAIKKKFTRKKDIREIDQEATNIIRGGAQTAQRKGEDMDNLSDRVWNLKDGIKDNITIQIKNAIAQGLSPKQAQDYVVKYLQNPKLITMHVYDKDGNLTLSEEAKNLHPGRGVYRDPLKNAERLLRTEMMAAYRKAEIEQYQKTDLIIGYEIKLSGNHTTLNGKGKPIKLKDICDTLQGKYPKTFIWHGWHPNCRCVLLPLYVSDDKMESYFDAKHNGTLDEWSKNNQISKLPNNFNDWVEDNSQRLKDAQSAKNKQFPQWMNNELAQEELDKQPNKYDHNGVRYVDYEDGDITSADRIEAEELKPKIDEAFEKVMKSLGQKVEPLQYEVYNMGSETGLNIENDILTIKQSFPNGKDVAKLELAKVKDEDLQGKGLLKPLMKELLKNWQKQGLKRIELEAVSGEGYNGAYTWARYGFKANTANEIITKIPCGHKYFNFIYDYVKDEMGGKFGNPFDVNLLINKFGKKEVETYFKENGITWRGFLDLEDEDQVRNFIDYCG